MFTTVALPELREEREPSRSVPLNEALWHSWVEKGRAQDRRDTAVRMRAVTWISVAGLLAMAGFWSRLSQYEVMVKCIVTAGAMVAMFHAIHARRYGFAGVFGALALLYNPVVPVFHFSGDWLRLVAVASAAPFVASLALRNERTEHHD
jgi:hypothetical protein